MDALDLTTLDIESMKALYHKNLALLNEKLLNGAEWHETSDLRHFVTQLEIAIDKKLRPINGAVMSDFTLSITNCMDSSLISSNLRASISRHVTCDG